MDSDIPEVRLPFVRGSASQVISHRDCNRLWFLEKVCGIPGGSSKAAELGGVVHDLVEDHTIVGTPFEDTRAGRIAALGAMHYPMPSPLNAAWAERSFFNDVDFIVPLSGYMDWVDPKDDVAKQAGFDEFEARRQHHLKTAKVDPETGELPDMPAPVESKRSVIEQFARVSYPLVRDYKSRSSFNYAPSSRELGYDTQAHVYVVQAFREFPNAEKVRFEHLNLSTRAPRKLLVPRDFTRDDRDQAVERINTELAAMQVTAATENAADVEATGFPRRCDKYGPCPHKMRCAVLGTPTVSPDRVAVHLALKGKKKSTVTPTIRGKAAMSLQARLAAIKAKAAANAAGASPVPANAPFAKQEVTTPAALAPTPSDATAPEQVVTKQLPLDVAPQTQQTPLDEAPTTKHPLPRRSRLGKPADKMKKNELITAIESLRLQCGVVDGIDPSWPATVSSQKVADLRQYLGEVELILDELEENGHVANADIRTGQPDQPVVVDEAPTPAAATYTPPAPTSQRRTLYLNCIPTGKLSATLASIIQPYADIYEDADPDVISYRAQAYDKGVFSVADMLAKSLRNDELVEPIPWHITATTGTKQEAIFVDYLLATGLFDVVCGVRA